MAGEFLSVPGNIKQIFLPFVLDPENKINTAPIEVSNNNKSVSGGVGSTQVFSFRKSVGGKDKNALLRIAPNSFYDQNQFSVNDDISYRLLYGQNPSEKKSINPLVDVLDNIPRISIREYLQDAKLDQIMNFFGEIGRSFSSGEASGEKAKNDESTGFMQSLSNLTKSFMSGISGGSVLIGNIGLVMDDIFGKVCDSATMQDSDSVNVDYRRFVLKIPYLLYYKVLSATSTNIYEIPFSGQVMCESNGLNGWKSGNLLGGYEGGSSSMLGNLANWFGKNIKINQTPTWDGAQDDNGTTAEIEFSLFNDSIEGALMNFIFVNTIIPGNMWMQYHIFQHAPNLYDVRIEGVKRLFMCAADFKVEYGGVLRKPSAEFCKRLAKYVNKNCVKLDEKMLQDLVKIPDVYKVSGRFTSLLPNNFNNYLYTYYNNGTIGTLSGKKLHEASVLDSVMDNAKKELYAIFHYPNRSKAAFEAKINTKTPPGRLDTLISEIEKAEKSNKTLEDKVEEPKSAEHANASKRVQ